MESVIAPKKRIERTAEDEAVASVHRSLRDAVAGKIKPLSSLEEQPSK